MDVLRELEADVVHLWYAISFQRIVEYIVQQVPSEEVTIGWLRDVITIPEIAIREICANALIHQDFFETGAWPMIEIFSDRIEITNPWKPMIAPDRFLDHAPKSRNEDVASFLRRIKVCEERWHGIDKAMVACEVYNLPWLDIEDWWTYTRVTLFQRKELKSMTALEKNRIAYWHCGLRHIQKDPMTNASLRERLRVKKSNYPIVSGIIANSIDKGLIKPFDPENKSNKYAKYIPFWA